LGKASAPMSRMLRLAGAALLALGSSLAAAGAEPAVWRVSDADTTVTLFGTVHLLPTSSDWSSPTLDAAMERADALWLEIDILRDTSAGWAMITEGTSPDKSLRDRLSAEDYAKVEAAASKVGVAMATLEKLRPWLASITITAEAIKKAGYDGTGVDLQLARAAVQDGIPVHGLETGKEQIAFLSSLPEQEEVAMLLQSAHELDTGPALFARMFGAWYAGDRSTLEDLLVESMGQSDPDLVDRLLGDRNKAWADRFEEIIGPPGERVVAVGAAHLVGKDNLPDLLAAMGYRVELLTGDE
jgi:uncharacterized protein YbaP (TraB family)